MKPGREMDAKVAQAMGYTVIWADDPVFGPTPYIHDKSAVKIGPHSTRARLLGGYWETLRVDGQVVEVFCRLVPSFSTDDHEVLALLKLEPMTVIPVEVYPDEESNDRTGVKWIARDWQASIIEADASSGEEVSIINLSLTGNEARNSLAWTVCEMFLKIRGVSNG